MKRINTQQLILTKQEIQKINKYFPLQQKINFYLRIHQLINYRIKKQSN
jgi:hypothetical protein